VAEIRDAFTAQAESGFVEGLSDYHYKYDPADPLSRWPRMLQPHRHTHLPLGALTVNRILDDRLVAVLRDLLGEDPLAAQTMFYFKPPGARGQDFHQDDFYLKTKPGNCLAAWFALDPADAENGGLEVVPGSHRVDVMCPGQADLSRYFANEHVEIPEGMKPISLRMDAGDVLFFNGRVIHGSQPNSSKDRFRRSLIAHYVPRSSLELIGWDSPALAPDRTLVTLPGPTGGGPCGEFQPMGPH
jgi:ectoine hydroxylase-related dioxygenase (phytanoyl-CoA dioxygenase family)